MNKKLLFLCAAFSLPIYSKLSSISSGSYYDNNTPVNLNIQPDVCRDAQTEVLFDSIIEEIIERLELHGILTAKRLSEEINKLGLPIEVIITTVNGAPIVNLHYQHSDSYRFGQIQCADQSVVRMLEEQLAGKPFTAENVKLAIESARIKALRQSPSLLKRLQNVMVDYKIVHGSKKGQFNISLQITRETDPLKLTLIFGLAALGFFGARQAVRHNQYGKRLGVVGTEATNKIATDVYLGKMSHSDGIAGLINIKDAHTSDQKRALSAVWGDQSLLDAPITTPAVLTAKQSIAQEKAEFDKANEVAPYAVAATFHVETEQLNKKMNALDAQQKDALAVLSKAFGDVSILKTLDNKNNGLITSKDGKINFNEALNKLIGKESDKTSYEITWIVEHATFLLDLAATASQNYSNAMTANEFLKKNNHKSLEILIADILKNAKGQPEALKDLLEKVQNCLTDINNVKLSVVTLIDPDTKAIRYGKHAAEYVFAIQKEPATLQDQVVFTKRDGAVLELQKLYTTLINNIKGANYFANTTKYLHELINLIKQAGINSAKAQIAQLDDAIKAQVTEHIKAVDKPLSTVNTTHFDDMKNILNVIYNEKKVLCEQFDVALDITTAADCIKREKTINDLADIAQCIDDVACKNIENINNVKTVADCAKDINNKALDEQLENVNSINAAIASFQSHSVSKKKDDWLKTARPADQVLIPLFEKLIKDANSIKPEQLDEMKDLRSKAIVNMITAKFDNISDSQRNSVNTILNQDDILFTLVSRNQKLTIDKAVGCTPEQIVAYNKVVNVLRNRAQDTLKQSKAIASFGNDEAIQNNWTMTFANILQIKMTSVDNRAALIKADMFDENLAGLTDNEKADIVAFNTTHATLDPSAIPTVEVTGNTDTVTTGDENP